MLQTIADWLGTHRDELIVGVVLLAVGVIGAWLSGLGKILWRKLFMCNDTAPAPTVVVQPIQIVKEADRQLDIRPGIRPAMEDPGNVTKWVLFAEIRAIDKEAHVRDAYIETSDHIKLRPCWATHRTSGWAVAAETVFTIPAGETLTIYFGVHVKEGRGKVVAPDYYHAPWGHTSTATHVVVRTIDGDHASIANSPVRELADAVARYRSSHGRVNNASATFKSGGTITHVRR